MRPLNIAWEYLTGCCVATNVSDRGQAEWPPHPARVFMALAAAWFESDRDEAEGAALGWLESLGDPHLLLPPEDSVAARSVVDVYVPVNDKAGLSKALLQTAPSMTRDRQPRTFPTTWVGDAVCAAQWPDVDGLDQHRDALASLCSRVTRIGHPSSLVRMWVAHDISGEDESTEAWEPTDVLAELQVRKITPGFLQSLTTLYGEDSRQRHEQLTAMIESLKAEKKATKGKGSKEKKAEIDQQISDVEAELSTINPRPPIRPTVGLWCGYSRTSTTSAVVRQSHFNTDLLILTQTGGPRLPLEATLQVTKALRGAVMKPFGENPMPEWISGHATDGSRSEAKDGHMAIIPLPFVGQEHADGHLLGAALVFPEAVRRDEQGKYIGPLIVDELGQSKTIELKFGPLGIWELQRREWSERRVALKPEVWTACPNGATTWASVTPVVLDRFPKKNRTQDRLAWNEEVATIIRQACKRVRLPEPIEIDLDTTSWHRGVPRATCKRRRLRAAGPGNTHADASLGDGFPPLPARGTNAPRLQIHVWMRFDQPVNGPVLIGAGRYRGYGLFRPLDNRQTGGPS